MSTDWEQMYVEGDTPWDKGAPAPPLLEWLEKWKDRISGRVLVPGCGLGHDVRALAAHSSKIFPVGLDISESAIRKARNIPPVGNESYQVGDLFALDESMKESFDWIWEHTCFCAIDPKERDNYVQAVQGALKPGGHLLCVFYLNPYDNEHQPGEGPPYGSTLEELKKRFVKSKKFELLESYIPDQAYPGREGLEQVMLFSKRKE